MRFVLRCALLASLLSTVVFSTNVRVALGLKVLLY